MRLLGDQRWKVPRSVASRRELPSRGVALERLTLEKLAERTSETTERLRRWETLGLIARVGDHFGPDSVERVRLIAFAERRGIPPETIADAPEEQGDVLAHYMELAGVTPGAVTSSLDEAANLSGLDAAFVRRLWVAAGLSDEPEMYDEDIEMLRSLSVARSAGMPEEALLQVVRVFNDALSRVADAETRLFHFYVHERLRADGLSGAELATATTDLSAPLLGLVEPTVLYFHRRAWQRAVREDMVMHLAENVRHPNAVVGRVPVAVMFVDLAGFTLLTEAMGDTAAAAVIERFSDLVREAASDGDGRVLKQIGDEFMLVFPSGEAAVRCGLSILASSAAETEFPGLHLGAHVGEALYREGDYLGTTVNVAARVATEARRGQFLVTDAVRVDARSVDDAIFVPVGQRSLKGLSDEIVLFEVAPRATTQPRSIDPVCGMSVDPTTCDASLSWRGEQLVFCSDRCLQRFVSAPDEYGSHW